MTIEYHDIVKVDSKRINEIIKNAVKYIENEIYGNQEEDEDEFTFLEINQDSLCKKLNISKELFTNIIYDELEKSLIIKKIELKSSYDKLYFVFKIKMKVYEMEGCIINGDGITYRFHPDKNSEFSRPFFKEYKKCRIIIQEIKEK